MTIETFGRFCRPVNFFIPEDENINSTAAALLDVGFGVPMAGFASFGICRTFTDGRFGMRRIDVTGIVPLVAHFTGFRPAAFFCARYLRRNGNPTNQDQDGKKDKPQESSLHRTPRCSSVQSWHYRFSWQAGSPKQIQTNIIQETRTC
jgi:hypothetical protein